VGSYHIHKRSGNDTAKIVGCAMNENESLQIGELIGEVRGINTRLDKFNGQIEHLADIIHTLPCQEHGVRIKLLEKSYDNDRLDKRTNRTIRGNITAQIIGSAIAAGAGIGWALWQYFG